MELHDVSASGLKVVVSPSPGDVEPDLLDDQQKVVGCKYVPTTLEAFDGEKVQVPSDREKRRKVGKKSPPLSGDLGIPEEDSATPMEFGMVDLCQCGVAFHPSSLSDSDLMSEVRFSVESIAYDGSKEECKVIDFCGSHVKLWKPSYVISDTTLVSS